MNALIKQMNEITKNEEVEDNLFVNNIIVNKDNNKKAIVPYIATEKWIGQLGERLLIN
tara:strand:+ start:442 stop:615 length:174 start_codon:yes stop_codon:yes gene_type:complete